MSRPPAMALFTHDHRRELAHAHLLRKAADGEAATRVAAADAFAVAFFTDTVEHFRREEEGLFPLYVRHAGTTALLERILREHMQLHGLVRALRAEVAAGDVAPETMRTLSDVLHDHVRLEERELFEEIRRTVPPGELEVLEWPKRSQ